MKRFQPILIGILLFSLLLSACAAPAATPAAPAAKSPRRRGGSPCGC